VLVKQIDWMTRSEPFPTDVRVWDLQGKELKTRPSNASNRGRGLM